MDKAACTYLGKIVLTKKGCSGSALNQYQITLVWGLLIPNIKKSLILADCLLEYTISVMARLEMEIKSTEGQAEDLK